MDLKGNSPLHKILNCKNHVSLDHIEPPFIYIEDEKGGHCPYGWSISNSEYEEWDCVSFFRDIGRKEKKELHKKYKKGIDRSVNIFNKRLKTINKRELQDDTLVIFLSDHGEILGEYGGLVSHGDVTVPEVVYVPVIFIHPDLPKNLSFSKEGVLRHVDIFPTICDILNIRVKRSYDGISIINQKKLPKYGYCNFVAKKRFNNFKYLFNYIIIENSIWDKDGGYVCRKGNFLKILIRANFISLLSNNKLTSIYNREQIKNKSIIDSLKDYWKMMTTFCYSNIKYGVPSDNIKNIKYKFI